MGSWEGYWWVLAEGYEKCMGEGYSMLMATVGNV
jgi:hypothetical protein